MNIFQNWDCLHLDQDWFAIDRNGVVLHFMSNCAPLPELVAQNIELHDSVGKALLTLPQIALDTKLLDTFDPIFIANAKPGIYLEIIAPWHERGIPSFDMHMPQHLQWKGYFLLSLPAPLLHFSVLPLEIQRELCILHLDFDVMTDHWIPYSGG